MIAKMHRSANIIYTYVNRYYLVVRLSCRLEAAVNPSSLKTIVVSSGVVSS